MAVKLLDATPVHAAFAEISFAQPDCLINLCICLAMPDYDKLPTVAKYVVTLVPLTWNLTVLFTTQL